MNGRRIRTALTLRVGVGWLNLVLFELQDAMTHHLDGQRNFRAPTGPKGARKGDNRKTVLAVGFVMAARVMQQKVRIFPAI